MKGWYAVLSALILTCSPYAGAADRSEDAARELARKIAALTGREAVALAYRPIPPVPAAELARVRRLVEAALREAGVRVDAAGATEVRIALSENQTVRLLTGEARKGDERQTWILSWPLAPASAPAPKGGVRLERRLLWEQAEPVLDAAPSGDSWLVLSTGKLALLAYEAERLVERQSVPIAPARPWPRDPRGRLLVSDGGLRVYLPGTMCTGSAAPALALDCKASDEPWPLDSGGRHLLLAHYAAARNHFEGRVVTQAGARRSVPPFYTAAAVEEGAEVVWVMSGIDGRALLFDRGFAPAATLGNWGSDLAGPSIRCGGAQPLVATQPGDENEALQVFHIVNRQAEALSAPLALPGPVTALWPAAEGVLAVVRDASGKYAVYQVRIVCAP